MFLEPIDELCTCRHVILTVNGYVYSAILLSVTADADPWPSVSCTADATSSLHIVLPSYRGIEGFSSIYPILISKFPISLISASSASSRACAFLRIFSLTLHSGDFFNLLRVSRSAESCSSLRCRSINRIIPPTTAERWPPLSV